MIWRNSSASNNRMSVDLPDPVEPMIATVWPFSTLKEMFLMTQSSASGYLKQTFLIYSFETNSVANVSGIYLK